MTLADLQPPFEAIIPTAHRIQSWYRHYCTNISTPDHAMSVQTAAYLLWLCEQRQPHSVADLGSGFSSFVLRLYAAEANRPVVVHSVDHNELWMSKSASFAKHHKMSEDGFLLGDQWLELGTRYDVVVNDYAGGETRDEFALYAIDRLTDTGVVIFDDAHHYGHRSNMATACHERGLVLLDLFHQTIDVMGRYAMIGARP